MLEALLVIAAVLLISATWPVTRRLWTFNLTAARFALLWLVERTGIRGLYRRFQGKPPQPLTNARLLRRFCEDMGPTFIKLGQIIASSAGMFPKEYVAEFTKCLDRVKPFSFEEAQQILQEELGERRQALGSMEEKPIASASIAQVHGARLDDGTEVVVKVQRPGIQKLIAADIQIMRWVAQIVVRLRRSSRSANPVGVIEDFAATLAEELDFRREAENLTRFNEIMRELGYADIRAPVPQWELSTRRVLVMERFRGVRVDQVEEIRERGIDAEGALVKGLRAWFQTVIFHGFFHGDVHAGNLLLLEDGSIGFLDFGIVGRFDERQRWLVTDYMVSFVTGDYKKLAQVLVSMGGAPPDLDMDSLSAGLERAYGPLLKMSFAQIDPGEIIPRINEVANQHKLVLPREFVLILKQFLYFDRYARLLAPNLNIFTDPRLLMSLAGDIGRARSARGAHP